MTQTLGMWATAIATWQVVGSKIWFSVHDLDGSPTNPQYLCHIWGVSEKVTRGSGWCRGRVINYAVMTLLTYIRTYMIVCTYLHY